MRNSTRIVLTALLSLATTSCAFRTTASAAPRAVSELGKGPSLGLEIRGVDQESTFGCGRNIPIAAAEFEVLNPSPEVRSLRILGLKRLVARCPDEQSNCTVSDLWRGADPQRADSSPEPIQWLRLTSHQDASSSLHSVDDPIPVPPGVALLTLGIEPWFPYDIPHWLRGKFRVGGEEVYSIERVFGLEILCQSPRRQPKP